MRKDASMEAALQQPITIRVPDAARISSLSERTIWRMIERGELDTVRLGKRRLIRRDSFEKLLGGMGDEG